MITIHCTGIYRSGTTLVYQILQKLIQQTTGGTIKVVNDGFECGGYYVTKLHQDWMKRQDIDNETIYCFRDLRDVLVSFFHRDGSDFTTMRVIDNWDIIRFIKEMIEYDRFVEQSGHFDLMALKYEEDILDVPELVNMIAGFINVPYLYNTQIAEEVTLTKNKKYTDGLKQLDRRTNYHPRHIYDGKIGKWKSRIGYKELRELYTKTDLKQWLIKKGYNA